MADHFGPTIRTLYSKPYTTSGGATTEAVTITTDDNTDVLTTDTVYVHVQTPGTNSIQACPATISAVNTVTLAPQVAGGTATDPSSDCVVSILITRNY